MKILPPRGKLESCKALMLTARTGKEKKKKKNKYYEPVQFCRGKPLLQANHEKGLSKLTPFKILNVTPHLRLFTLFSVVKVPREWRAGLAGDA